MFIRFDTNVRDRRTQHDSVGHSATLMHSIMRHKLTFYGLVVYTVPLISVSVSLNFCRLKLRRLLQESNLYRPQLLLGKIKDTDLYAECAILYGKVVAGLIYCVIDNFCW